MEFTNLRIINWSNVLENWDGIGKMLKKLNLVSSFIVNDSSALVIEIPPMFKNGVFIDLNQDDAKLQEDMIKWMGETELLLKESGIEYFPIPKIAVTYDKQNGLCKCYIGKRIDKIADELILLHGEREVSLIYDTMAKKIKENYPDAILVGVLKGGAYSLFELLRRLENDRVYGFISCSSYGDSTEPKDCKVNTCDFPNVEGKTIVVIDDIFDTGGTAKKIANVLSLLGAKKVIFYPLIRRSNLENIIKEQVDQGIYISSNMGFIVGCGMGLGEKYRNLKELFVLKKK